MKTKLLFGIWLTFLLLCVAVSVSRFGFSEEALSFFQSLLRTLIRIGVATMVTVAIYFIWVQPFRMCHRSRIECGRDFQDLSHLWQHTEITAGNYHEFLHIVERLNATLSNHLREFPKDKDHPDIKRWQEFADRALEYPAPAMPYER